MSDWLYELDIFGIRKICEWEITSNLKNDGAKKRREITLDLTRLPNMIYICINELRILYRWSLLISHTLDWRLTEFSSMFSLPTECKIWFWSISLVNEHRAYLHYSEILLIRERKQVKLYENEDYFNYLQNLFNN